MTISKEDIKQVVREMIDNDEIKVYVDVSRIDTDDFGNSTGALEEVEVWLECVEVEQPKKFSIWIWKIKKI